jgi:hypothetical protein
LKGYPISGGTGIGSENSIVHGDIRKCELKIVQIFCFSAIEIYEQVDGNVLHRNSTGSSCLKSLIVSLLDFNHSPSNTSFRLPDRRVILKYPFPITSPAVQFEGHASQLPRFSTLILFCKHQRNIHEPADTIRNVVPLIFDPTNLTPKQKIVDHHEL